VTEPDRLTRLSHWAGAFEFAVWVCMLHLAFFFIVAFFGGPYFATQFDQTEVRCGIATALISFPFVTVLARYRCLRHP
jgi:hypothetical protein